jgi:hypothetical protein
VRDRGAGFATGAEVGGAVSVAFACWNFFGCSRFPSSAVKRFTMSIFSPFHFARAKMIQVRPPMFELLEVFRDALGKKNMAGVTAIHHPLGHIDSGSGHVGAPVHIDYTANRSAVRAHPQSQLWVFL